MAEIKFLPVCSKCNKIIWEQINYEAQLDKFANSRVYAFCSYAITPYECPYCGEVFESITMPTKLPFDNKLEGVSYNG